MSKLNAHLIGGGLLAMLLGGVVVAQRLVADYKPKHTKPTLKVHADDGALARQKGWIQRDDGTWIPPKVPSGG